MFNFRVITLAITLAVSAAALAVAPLASAKGGDPASGSAATAPRNSTAKLKLSHEDGGIEVEFQVDQNRNGVPWKVTLRRNGALVASTTKTTHAPSGSFSLHRVISGAQGTDHRRGDAHLRRALHGPRRHLTDVTALPGGRAKKSRPSATGT